MRKSKNQIFRGILWKGRRSISARFGKKVCIIWQLAYSKGSSRLFLVLKLGFPCPFGEIIFSYQCMLVIGVWYTPSTSWLRNICFLWLFFQRFIRVALPTPSLHIHPGITKFARRESQISISNLTLSLCFIDHFIVLER